LVQGYKATSHVTRTPLSRSRGKRSTCRQRGYIVAASRTVCQFFSVSRITPKLLNRFSQNSVEMWHVGYGRKRQFFVVIWITLRYATFTLGLSYDRHAGCMQAVCSLHAARPRTPDSPASMAGCPALSRVYIQLQAVSQLMLVLWLRLVQGRA